MKSRYKIGDVVEVNKDIHRAQGFYAKTGERGTIIEIFRPIGTGAGEKKALCAKVKINDSQAIKTFRLTSLDKAE